MSPLCQLQMTLPGGFPGVSGVTVRLMSDGELTRLEVLPPDVVSVSKSQDGKAVDHAATVEKGEAPLSEAEVANFWKGLTPEERYRISYAATRDRPYVPLR